MTTAILIDLAKTTAATHSLDPALVCAVCETESNWEPSAARAEPAFLRRYVKPLNLDEAESACRSISWGLMQVMGQVARELGYSDPLPGLCTPQTGLTYGCLKLKDCVNKSDGTAAALLRYNGGGDPNYPTRVMSKLVKYQSSS